MECINQTVDYNEIEKNISLNTENQSEILKSQSNVNENDSKQKSKKEIDDKNKIEKYLNNFNNLAFESGLFPIEYLKIIN